MDLWSSFAHLVQVCPCRFYGSYTIVCCIWFNVIHVVLIIWTISSQISLTVHRSAHVVLIDWSCNKYVSLASFVMSFLESYFYLTMFCVRLLDDCWLLIFFLFGLTSMVLQRLKLETVQCPSARCVLQIFQFSVQFEGGGAVIYEPQGQWSVSWFLRVELFLSMDFEEVGQHDGVLKWAE